MFTTPSFKKSLIVEQFQGNYLKSQNQIEERQSIDIHDVLNAQGFAMHYRAILNTGSHFEVYRARGLL